MTRIRQGLGVLALALVTSAISACAGNSRTNPDWNPRIYRGGGEVSGTARGKPAKAKANKPAKNKDKGQRGNSQGKGKGKKKGHGSH